MEFHSRRQSRKRPDLNPSAVRRRRTRTCGGAGSFAGSGDSVGGTRAGFRLGLPFGIFRGGMSRACPTFTSLVRATFAQAAHDVRETSSTGAFRRAAPCMNCSQMGSAACAPVSPLPRDRLLVVIAHPNTSGELRREACEPSIGEIVGRAGLFPACRPARAPWRPHPSRNSRRLRGAPPSCAPHRARPRRAPPDAPAREARRRSSSRGGSCAGRCESPSFGKTVKAEVCSSRFRSAAPNVIGR